MIKFNTKKVIINYHFSSKIIILKTISKNSIFQNFPKNFVQLALLLQKGIVLFQGRRKENFKIYNLFSGTIKVIFLPTQLKKKHDNTIVFLFLS